MPIVDQTTPTASETQAHPETSSCPEEAEDGISLPDAWSNHKELSGRASDVNRQLAFAAIAIVWVFRGAEGPLLEIPDLLIWAGLLSAGALAADLLHYVAATLCWGQFARAKEKENPSTKVKFLAPAWINVPATVLFWIKISAVGTAYLMIGVFLIRALA